VTVTPLGARALAERQRAADEVRCAERPALLAIRRARLAASTLGFLRGSAPLFYAILADHPALAEGPAGDGWIAGDLHVENFGAFRVDAMQIEAAGGETVFDLNDLDDGLVAPLRFDVLRLATSALIAARRAGLDGAASVRAVAALVEAHAAALAGAPLPPLPPPITAHLRRASERTREQLLDRRTEWTGGARRFVRGERYLDLAPALVDHARAAFAAYVAALPHAPGAPPEAFVIDDIALRVAGTGSLGCLRVAVLTRGRGGKHGAWIFDLKEEGLPAAAPLVGPTAATALPPGERVLAASRALLRVPPRMSGATTLAGRSMFVRRLAPQEDKLTFDALARADVPPVLTALGALAGAAHRRGAAATPPAFDAPARAALVERAVELAALHEAAYLAYCALSR
jgi:uncharacterized protein (DUF2252 family)